LYDSTAELNPGFAPLTLESKQRFYVGQRSHSALAGLTRRGLRGFARIFTDANKQKKQRQQKLAA
jgi:hypothetical protein